MRRGKPELITKQASGKQEAGSRKKQFLMVLSLRDEQKKIISSGSTATRGAVKFLNSSIPKPVYPGAFGPAPWGRKLLPALGP
jgi:hypothetical protein